MIRPNGRSDDPDHYILQRRTVITVYLEVTRTEVSGSSQSVASYDGRGRSASGHEIVLGTYMCTDKLVGPSSCS